MKAPTLGSWFGRKEMAAPADIESAALRSDRFRLERESDWRRLEDIIARMEKGGLKRIDDDDLLALPTLYRTAASSLSVARETSLDLATLSYLESLVQRAWFQVYGPRKGFFAWLREFLFGGWSRAVREIWLDICIALFVMVAGAVVGWLLVVQDQDWYYRLVPAQMAGGVFRGQAGKNCFRPCRWRKAPAACPLSPPICSATMRACASSPLRWALRLAFRP